MSLLQDGVVLLQMGSVDNTDPIRPLSTCQSLTHTTHDTRLSRNVPNGSHIFVLAVFIACLFLITVALLGIGASLGLWMGFYGNAFWSSSSNSLNVL